MRNQNRYKNMETVMCIAILVDLILFVTYLIAAGAGIVWLKVVSSILTILLAALCLVFLYFTGELLKQRSLWMGTAAAAIVICLLFSLILNFPSPSPYTNSPKTDISTTEQ